LFNPRALCRPLPARAAIFGLARRLPLQLPKRGLQKMIRAIRAIGFSFFLGTLAAGTGAGCVTASGGLSRSHDLHAATRVGGDGARVLVVGPALLMHVDVDGRDDLALYTVARKDGTEADCAGPLTGERKHLRPGTANLVNLTVPDAQVVCIAVEPNTRTASVMWHARRIDGGAVSAHGQALALEDLDR
jgi:hypothetical protein